MADDPVENGAEELIAFSRRDGMDVEELDLANRRFNLPALIGSSLTRRGQPQLFGTGATVCRASCRHRARVRRPAGGRGERRRHQAHRCRSCSQAFNLAISPSTSWDQAL
jgi:hypothetical protein